MSGTEKLAGLLKTLVDNAHAGKLFTDFAPGLILTAALLLVVAEFTTFEIFPYKHAETYAKALDKAELELTAARDDVAKLEGKVGALTARKTQAEKGIEEEARAAKARLDAELTQDDKPAAEGGNPANGAQAKARDAALDTLIARDRASLDGLVGALAEIAQQLSTETIHKNAAQARVTRLEADVTAKRTRSDEARTLSGNVAVIADNLAELLGFALVLGAILAQISGKVFWNGSFWNYLVTKEKRVATFVSPKDKSSETYWRGKASDGVLGKLPDLDKDYYRYVEIAMNSILPMCAAALALAVVGIRLWSAGTLTSAGPTLVLAGLAAGAAWLLYANARVLYVGYFLKKADVLRVLREDVEKKPVPLPEIPA